MYNAEYLPSAIRSESVIKGKFPAAKVKEGWARSEIT